MILKIIRLNAGDVKGGGHCWCTYLAEKDNVWYILDWCYWYNESKDLGRTWKDAEKYYDDATPKFMQDFSVFDEQLGGGKPSDYTGVNTMVSNSMYVSPTMDGSYSKPEAVVKTVNVMDAEEFDKHIDSILKYNGLIYELRNEFDKLKDTKDLTDDQVRVLMLNKMLQKLLDAGMSPEDLAVMKRENEYYKKSCEDLLNTIEKDSDEADRLRLKLKMQ